MPMCSMNMLWNTQIADTCIVFSSWHISSNGQFILSCIAVAALGILYEYLRVVQGAIDVRVARALASSKGKAHARSGSRTPDGDSEEAGLLSGRRASKSLSRILVPPAPRALRAVVYGLIVFLSFFLMLIFMTYNAYLILAVVVGASLGHYIFGGTMDIDAVLNNASGGKSMACH
ncbi:Ctr copper transporter [Schizophyllum amplum]|uniref:Copper transport protein n=1 Tax=Schizophyllum amplum TaxID=97359 RepID=A0A550CWV2_9AGAR|nr:Ctr copper transporter [Auriculariopsis ampla]